MSTSKKIRNRVDRATGRAKERVGEFTGDHRLRNEGRAAQAKARLRTAGERVKDAVRGR